MNEWKRYFVWRATFEHFEWKIGNPADSYALNISEDGKTCFLGVGKDAHAHAFGERGWNKGRIISSSPLNRSRHLFAK